jgi:hypothetical protein
MSLSALSPREASIFACICDTAVAPEPLLPPVTGTDAVKSFDNWLARAPRLNRVGLKALLYVSEMAPRLLGFDGRLRRLDRAARALALERAEGLRSPKLRQLVKLVKGIAFLSYYGDDGVMRRLGYDADANIRRSRAARVKEGRP